MGAENDRRVVGLRFEVNAVFGGGGQGDLQLRVALLYRHQPGHQPADGAGWRLQAHHRLLLTRLLGDGDQAAKRRLELRIEGAALGRQAQPARVAFKKRETEPSLQRGNLAAHRALGQAQLARGVGQVEVPGSHQKGLDGIKRQGAPRHVVSSYAF